MLGVDQYVVVYLMFIKGEDVGDIFIFFLYMNEEIDLKLV